MRVIFDREQCEDPGLFHSGVWMDRAEEWAKEHGMHIRQWRVDQRFRAAKSLTTVHDCWYRIQWNGEQWTVENNS